MKQWLALLGLAALLASPASAYDRAAALAFASDQWNVPVYAGQGTSTPAASRVPPGTPQPEYPCAEFVSRCLAAGGIDAPGKCPGFRQCVSLFNWLIQSGNGTPVASVEELTAGDVIFYKEVGSAREWSHAALVIDSVTKNIAAHNKARWNVPWTWGVVKPERTAFLRIGANGSPGQSPAELPVSPSLPSPQITAPGPSKAAEATPSPRTAPDPLPELSPIRTIPAPGEDAPKVEKPQEHHGGLRGLLRKLMGKDRRTAPPSGPEMEPAGKGSVSRETAPARPASDPGKPQPELEEARIF